MGILLRRIVTNPFLMWRRDAVELLRLAVDTFDEDRAREVAAELARNETWQGATLIRQCACVCGDTERFQANDDLRYMDRRTRRHWDRFGAKFDKLPSLQKEAFRDMYDLQLRITHLFDAEGVRVLAGSDAGGGIWEVPGFALHEELHELVRAGLTPLGALQCATVNVPSSWAALTTWAPSRPGDWRTSCCSTPTRSSTSPTLRQSPASSVRETGTRARPSRPCAPPSRTCRRPLRRHTRGGERTAYGDRPDGRSATADAQERHSATVSRSDTVEANRAPLGSATRTSTSRHDEPTFAGRLFGRLVLAGA